MKLLFTQPLSRHNLQLKSSFMLTIVGLYRYKNVPSWLNISTFFWNIDHFLVIWYKNIPSWQNLSTFFTNMDHFGVIWTLGGWNHELPQLKVKPLSPVLHYFKSTEERQFGQGWEGNDKWHRKIIAPQNQIEDELTPFSQWSINRGRTTFALPYDQSWGEVTKLYPIIHKSGRSTKDLPYHP